MEKTYDYAIIGTGVAGLSLAFFLYKEGLLKNKTLLMLDQRKPDINDKTWSFWHTDTLPFSQLAYTKYSKMIFRSTGYSREQKIAPYCYSMIRAIDFYRHLLAILEQEPNIHWHFAPIAKLHSDGTLVQITSREGNAFQAKTGFNSAVPNLLQANHERYIHLKQHFMGWVVQFEQEVFAADAFTIHDFDIPQQGFTRFVYILPHTSREALVEFTIFSPEVATDEFYETQLKDYLQHKFGLPYRVIHQEFGVIPMTDDPYAHKNPPNLVNIGTLGGAVKPSTGYGFKRITHHTRRIAKALKKGKSIHKISARSAWHYQCLDSIMLEVLKIHGDKGAAIFTGLFRHRSPIAIFRFLDEQANLWQITSIMLAMPYKHLFFISMLKVLSRKIFLRRWDKG